MEPSQLLENLSFILKNEEGHLSPEDFTEKDFCLSKNLLMEIYTKIFPKFKYDQTVYMFMTMTQDDFSVRIVVRNLHLRMIVPADAINFNDAYPLVEINCVKEESYQKDAISEEYEEYVERISSDKIVEKIKKIRDVLPAV